MFRKNVKKQAKTITMFRLMIIVSIKVLLITNNFQYTLCFYYLI